MVRRPIHLVLWALVLLQGMGLCHCLSVQVSGAECGAATWTADGANGDHGGHSDRPGEELACSAKVSAKASIDQANLFVALLTPGVWEIPDPSPSFIALPVESLLAPSPSHQGRSLPLLI